MDTMNTNIDATPDANANREHKNSLFTFIFGEKEAALELYCAISGIDYGPGTKIEMATLKNPLYDTLMNDVSFMIDGKLVVLVEHQSTICRNMPLRMLLYAARWLERYTKESDIYSQKKIPLPRLEFYMLYNGEAGMPDDMIVLNLADSYMDSGEIFLDLKVPVLNINKGHNIEMAQRSPTLNGYETFTAKVREYVKIDNTTLEQAIDRTTEECISEGLLVKYLKLYRTEVRNMWATEWKLEDALKVRAKEAWEDGLEEGMEKGLEKGLEKGREEGLEEGLEKGREEGLEAAKVDTARELLALGVDVNIISRATKLSVDTILLL